MTRIGMTLALFFLLATQPILAQGGQPDSEKEPPDPPASSQRYSLEDIESDETGADPAIEEGPSAYGLLLRVGLTLALLVAALLGIAYLARRFGPGGVGLLRPSGPIRVLARSSLPPKHTLYLIHVGERILLVGSSGEHLTTLTEITDPAEMARLESSTLGERVDGIPAEFRSVITDAMKDYEESTPSEEPPQVPESLKDV